MSRRLLPEGGSQNTDKIEELTPRDPKEEKREAIEAKELMKAIEKAKRESQKEWRKKRSEGKKRLNIYYYTTLKKMIRVKMLYRKNKYDELMNIYSRHMI